MSNDILQFAPTDTGSNLLTQVEYAADTQRSIGNQPGIARAKLVNKVLRQCSFVASALTDYVATKTGSNVVDDGNKAALTTLMESALRFTPNISTKTSNYTLTATDDTILVDGTAGAFTITLPAAGTIPTGKMYTIKRTDMTLANTVSISGTIDGLTAWKLCTKDESYTIQSNGTTYYMLDHKTATDSVDAGTMTIGGTTTAPTYGTATISQNKVLWRREGKFAVITWRYAHSAAGTATAGSGDYLYNLPTGLVVDTTNITPYTTVGTYNHQDNMRALVGTGAGYDSGPSQLRMYPTLYSTTQFRIVQDTLFTSVGFKGSGFGPLTLGVQGYTVEVRVPILNWNF